MMADIDSEELIQRAVARYDNDEWADAAADFRAVFQAKSLPLKYMAFLHISEREASIAFLRELASDHPDSLGYQLQYVHGLSSAGRYRVAVRVLSELLESQPWVWQDEYKIRFVRFDCAIGSSQDVLNWRDQIVEDFTFLWRAMDLHMPARKFKKRFLRRLAAVNNLNSAEVFRELAELSFLDEASKRCLRAKAAELHELEAFE